MFFMATEYQGFLPLDIFIPFFKERFIKDSKRKPRNIQTIAS